MEDTLNLNEAPVIETGDTTRQMRFDFRAINSGLGTVINMAADIYPDEHLRMIAHAGMTAVDTYLLNILTDPKEAARVNDLTVRASNYGLDVIHSHSPEAEVVFWTYNWGYEKLEPREELLRAVPEDVTMMATFEMFEHVDIAPEIKEMTTDYTLWKISGLSYWN